MYQQRFAMKDAVLLRRVALLKTNVSEELSAFIVRVIRVGELGTTLAVTSNRRTLLVTVNGVPISPTLVTLMMEALSSSETSVLQQPHGVTSQKTAFFIVTAVKTSNRTTFDRTARCYTLLVFCIHFFSSYSNRRKTNQRFGGTWHFHLDDGRLGQ
jgi:hypothetical protein